MLTKLLRLNPTVGPKRFVFQDPNTGRKFRADTKQDLVKAIVAYRAANGLVPIKRLHMVLEHYWASLPENKADAEVAPPLERGWLTYIKGGMVLLEYLFYGEEKMVSQAEADTRAKQCVDCKFNYFPDKTTFVQWADGIAKASVGDASTIYDAALGNCQACSCVNKAKVWYKGPFTPNTKELSRLREVNCWQLKNLKSDKGKS